VRDIETPSRSQSLKFSNTQVQACASSNFLSEADKTRDWHVFGKLARESAAQVRESYRRKPLGVEHDQPVHAPDRTSTDLYLAMIA